MVAPYTCSLYVVPVLLLTSISWAVSDSVSSISVLNLRLTSITSTQIVIAWEYTAAPDNFVVFVQSYRTSFTVTVLKSQCTHAIRICRKRNASCVWAPSTHFSAVEFEARFRGSHTHCPGLREPRSRHRLLHPERPGHGARGHHQRLRHLRLRCRPDRDALSHAARPRQLGRKPRTSSPSHDPVDSPPPRASHQAPKGIALDARRSAGRSPLTPRSRRRRPSLSPRSESRASRTQARWSSGSRRAPARLRPSTLSSGGAPPLRPPTSLADPTPRTGPPPPPSFAPISDSDIGPARAGAPARAPAAARARLTGPPPRTQARLGAAARGPLPPLSRSRRARISSPLPLPPCSPPCSTHVPGPLSGGPAVPGAQDAPAP